MIATTSAPAAATAAPTPSPFHLTAEQIRRFDEEGYLILPGRIPADLLARVQDAAAAWIADGRRLDAEHPELTADNKTDFKFSARSGRRGMFRVDYVHDKGQIASLELLGSPEVLGIAESLAGPNFVPTYESLVFKDEGDGAPIDWHQDAVHPRTHRIFNIDIYLDSARKGEGSLRVAPGSQLTKVDVCQLEQEYGWDAPGVVQTELEPGDVLVHDVMVVHGSEAVTGNRLRRTVYYEFRAAEQIEAEGPWDAEFIDRRLRLVPLALDAHAARFGGSGAEPFAWNPDPRFRPEVTGDAAAELRTAHGIHTPGSYCSAGDVATTPIPKRPS